MANIFTFLFYPKKGKYTNQNKKADDELFAPSDRSIKTILDFAKSYEYADLKSCNEKDLYLN